MRRPAERTSGANAARGVLVAALLGAVAVTLVAPSPATTAAGTPALDHAELRVAFEAARPDPSGAASEGDALAWAERRLAERPDDQVAAGRKLGAHLRRFRATGSRAELDAAAQLVEALGGVEGRAAASATSLALAEHDFPGARRAARAAHHASDPGDGGGALVRFDALWASGMYDEAAELLPELEGRPASAGWLARVARYRDGQGDVEGARSLMARAVERVDGYAEPAVVRAWARVELGHFSAHSGDPAAAVDAYLDALRLVSGYPPALEGLAWIAWGVDGDAHAAQALFEDALDAGAHADVRLDLAEVYEWRGRNEAARAERERFLAEATADARSLRMYRRPLAVLLAGDEARLEEALAHAEADLALRGDRMAWAVRGDVLARLGRFDEALADAERALAWGSPEPTVLELTGRVNLAAGRTGEARRLLSEALEGSAELGPVTSADIRALLAGL